MSCKNRFVRKLFSMRFFYFQAQKNNITFFKKVIKRRPFSVGGGGVATSHLNILQENEIRNIDH